MLEKLKDAIEEWWRCRTGTCDYYTHYLANGPADLIHADYHEAERLAAAHFDDCRYVDPDTCPTCAIWQRMFERNRHV
jgi:hypothetical protein